MFDSCSKRPVDQGWALTLPVVLGPLMLLPLSGDAVDALVSYMTLLANGLVVIEDDIAVLQVHHLPLAHLPCPDGHHSSGLEEVQDNGPLPPLLLLERACLFQGMECIKIFLGHHSFHFQVSLQAEPYSCCSPAKERVEEAIAVGGDALRKAEEELDKLMANHTLHFKPEKQEEFLAKRGRKKPNKEEEWWRVEQVKEEETASEDESWGSWGPAPSTDQGGTTPPNGGKGRIEALLALFIFLLQEPVPEPAGLPLQLGWLPWGSMASFLQSFAATS